MREFWMRSVRLQFGRWDPADIDLALGLWGDDRVTRWIGGPFSSSQVRQRLAAEIDTDRALGFQYWPIFRSPEGTHVGCCGLRPYPEDAGVLEIGFHLRFEHWGRGYASEAARATIDQAFARPGVRGLFAGHHPQNAASRALLLKLGFVYTHDAFYAPTGLRHPSYMLKAPRP